MKRIILAAAFGIFAAGSAFAIENGDPFSTGDSHGPHKPSARTTYAYGTALPAAATPRRDPDFVPLGEGVVPQTSWNPFGTVVTPQADLDAQVAYNKAARRESYAGKTCQSDILATDQGAFCWGAYAANSGPNPTGGPVGAGLAGGE